MPDTNKLLPPGNLGFPVIGETLAFFDDPEFQKKRQAKYGRVYKTSIFGRPTIVAIGAEANDFLFRNENKCLTSIWWPKSTRVLLGKSSLAVLSGNLHGSRRKLLSQAFQPRALVNYIPTMERITREYLRRWETLGEFVWYPELRNYTFDIASTLFINKEGNSQAELRRLFEDWCDGLFSLSLPFPGSKYRKAIRSRRRILSLIEETIEQRQKEQNLPEDALGILLKAKDEEGNSLDSDELKDQILLLLFAGHETLTSAIASFGVLVARYPEVLQQIRLEQEEIEVSFPLTMDALKRMTYLEQVLKEVLRFIPPVAGGFREVMKTFEFDGYRIPKGWIIQYQIAGTHQDPGVYQNYDKFDPNRFSPERAEDKLKSFGYVPFGGGLHECLGKEFARMEMKILATHLAKNYEWELIADQDLEMVSTPTPRPRSGLQVKFGRRDCIE